MNKYRQLELNAKTNHRKEEYKYFVGTTLKNALEYKIFEKIIFKIRVRYMDDFLDIPYVSYNLISDDGKNENGFIEKSADGWFYIESSMSKSGFVYVTATACDENKQVIEGITPFRGSAGADVSNILRATKIPEDYLEFWDNLKAEVESTEPEILYCKKIDSEKHPDFEIYDMRIKAPRDQYVSLVAAYPKGAKKGSLKATFIFQGYGVWSVGAEPRSDSLTVAVNGHSIPNDETKEYYENLRDNELKGYGFDAVENEHPNTTYWARMMLRDLQAIRFFKDNELLNKKDYYFVGSSQGGMQACNMAAHFDRATAVIMNVPWLSDIYAHELCGRRAHRMPKGVGVTYFDTAVAAEYLKCPAYIISGLGDSTCNASTQLALFNSIKSPKYIELYQNKVHSFTIPWDRNVYILGDESLADKYSEHTEQYYEYD